MSLHIVITLVDPTFGLMIGGQAVASETMANPGTQAASIVPTDGRRYIMHLKAEVKMYYSVGVTPSAADNPRRLLLAGESEFLAVPAGVRVAWAAKA